MEEIKGMLEGQRERLAEDLGRSVEEHKALSLGERVAAWMSCGRRDWVEWGRDWRWRGKGMHCTQYRNQCYAWQSGPMSSVY